MLLYVLYVYMLCPNKNIIRKKKCEWRARKEWIEKRMKENSKIGYSKKKYTLCMYEIKYKIYIYIYLYVWKKIRVLTHLPALSTLDFHQIFRIAYDVWHHIDVVF
jgi:hypothetical protein